MQLFVSKDCPFSKRVELFLSYKALTFEKHEVSLDTLPLFEKLTLPIIVYDDGVAIDGSLAILREIEYRFPHPIGFVGPVEPKVQWASMLFTAHPYYTDIVEQSLSQTDYDRIWHAYFLPICMEIVEMVEDQYYIMGPTFSVADCIIAADLLSFCAYSRTLMPTELVSYIQRVFKKCRLQRPF